MSAFSVGSSMISLAIALVLSSASAADCALDSYSSDREAFAALSLSDFQEGVDGIYSYGHTEGAPYHHEGVDYWPTFWGTTTWCIPGMDEIEPCGGDNVYLANPWQLNMAPAVPTQAVAFDWGTQGASADITVSFDDGSSVVFGVGQTGFFGFCTGTDDVLITSVQLESVDGGVDNVGFGEVEAAPGPALTVSPPSLTAGAPTPVTVIGAEPGESVYLVFGLVDAPGACPPVLGGLCFGLEDARRVGAATADPGGTATFWIEPPAGAAGRTVGLQALAARGPGGADSVASDVLWGVVE
jgi:hypothetical protein